MNSTSIRNKTGQLQCSADGHHLVYEDGQPFLYLADTAWELFHRLTLEEAHIYLENRAAKGFTVIQAVALGELDGISKPNANGDLPFLKSDPSQPNESYFRHIDQVIEYAQNLGLFTGFLPTWGKYWKLDGRTSAFFTPDLAEKYGRFLGERYRTCALIWILGGDQNIDNPEEYSIIESMAKGLRAGDNKSHLITFHPRGPGRSSESLIDADWLDFNMCQTSHASRDHDPGISITYDYALSPRKPTLDGEPRYETMPVGFYNRDHSRIDRFNDSDTRQAAYWALFAGACGHTYGHNSVWQMWTPLREPFLWANIPWQEALDHPGAFQMGFIRRLFQQYPLGATSPSSTVIVDGPTSGGGKIRALMATDRSFALIYSPQGIPFTINMQELAPRRIKESWFDPRYGCFHYMHTTSKSAFQTYTPPTSGRGCDWILILEKEES